MTPERQRQIEELCQAVWERGWTALEGVDPELRSEVESRLSQYAIGQPSSDASEESTLSQLPAGVQMDLAKALADGSVPQNLAARIRDYYLLWRHTHGVARLIRPLHEEFFRWLESPA